MIDPGETGRLNPDSDGDGTRDGDDAFPTNPRESKDTDRDGIGDNADLDDDNDGVSDVDEEAAGTDPKDPNSKPGQGAAQDNYFLLLLALLAGLIGGGFGGWLICRRKGEAAH